MLLCQNVKRYVLKCFTLKKTPWESEEDEALRGRETNQLDNQAVISENTSNGSAIRIDQWDIKQPLVGLL